MLFVWGTGSTANIDFNFNDGNAFWLYFNGTGTPNITFGSDGDYGDGQWHHLAATRYNGMIRVWVDGVHKGSNNYSSSTSMGQTASLYIGSSAGAAHYWDGYLDEIRVVKGTALWKGGNDFVPPTRRGAGGPLIDRSQNLNDGTFVNGAGVEAAGPTTRRDGQVILPVTDAYIEFDGTDDYVNIPDSSLWDATGGISVSGWCYADSLGSYNVIVNQWSTAANSSSSWTLETVGSDWRFYLYDSGAATLKYASSTGTATTGVWKHIVGVFDGTTLKVYVNGVEGGTTAAVTTANTSSFPLRLGAVL